MSINIEHSAEQAAFVATWRAQNPRSTWGDIWTCPLCGKAIQNANANAQYQQSEVESHQRDHDQDWPAYVALGDAPRDGGGS